ncbi:hypothetical protein [Paenibacillus silvae]|uniref:hypothetical protein n=1 Tax=Paenibacillus silvae TaxID=1325358 RepID=UPI002002DBA0|nr:hypothetical protein [Paenibacillus silvae]MCK6074701.1 hypothetical protein [Paenibacillus silvae]MCK6147824.1 hypothetical protein [Paenibacillus silvae]MCK6266122.1 hypothetical protein [Paenibacillus silvae]
MKSKFLQVGNYYTRTELAGIWGYGGVYCLRRLVFKPANSSELFFFVTKYSEYSPFESSPINDSDFQLYSIKEIKEISCSHDKDKSIFLFFRESPKHSFMFFGEVDLSTKEFLSDFKVYIYTFKLKETSFSYHLFNLEDTRDKVFKNDEFNSDGLIKIDYEPQSRDHFERSKDLIGHCSNCGYPLKKIDSSKKLDFVVFSNSEFGITKKGVFDQLKSFLIEKSNAQELIIIDPYFLNYTDITYKSFFSTFINCLPSSLNKLLIVYQSNGNSNVHLENELLEYARKQKIDIKFNSTELIHDRVWIKDRCRAKVVGSSLNCLGNKLAFVLDLPTEDLNVLIKFMEHYNLLSYRLEI